MSAIYRQRPRRGPEPEPVSDWDSETPAALRWRRPLVLIAAFLMTWGLLQFVWAAQDVAKGGEDAVVGAANEANGLRTGITGLVLLAVVVVLSIPMVRRGIRMVWLWMI